MTVSINRDEWLAAINDAEGQSDPNSLTATEFGEQFGLNRNTARRRLEEMLKLGKVTRTKKYVADRTGRRQWYPAFKLVKAAAAEAKGKKR